MRAVFQWNVGIRRVELGKRTLVMGVLNVTPESFSDGGQFHDAQEAIQHGLRMIGEGADILDVGGESTRPGVRVGAEASVPASEEMARVLPVVEGLRKAKPDVLISVDTYKAEVARAAVAAGAAIVNDVSGLTWDPAMAEAMAELACGVVMMHTRGKPEEWSSQTAEPRIAQVVQQELHERVQRAIGAGVQHDRIVVDPGFGFGKRYDDNYLLLEKLQDLHSLGFPVLVGVSRKGFLGKTAGARFGADLPADARVNPSLAAAVISAMKGAHVVRVHDVRATVEAVAIADAVLADEHGMVNPWFDAYS